jgi:hypothetical protein
MSKSDVFLIISQIYIVGTIISNKNQVFLIIMSIIWFILSIIA